ncbi:hypothetical protein Q7P37_000980 [Cladosporium fusiforme]
MEPRIQRWLLVLFILVLTLALYRDFGNNVTMRRMAQHAATFAGHGPKDELAHTPIEPANATLGFGTILAVSRKESPRRSGLILAANITSIDIAIPPQPIWTPEDISHLRANRTSTITRGSALAWLGHLNALRAFLATPASTALIIEDDIDWDIHLRTVQIPKTASAFRSLTSDFHPTPQPDQYWGNTSTWDILWLGTCNEHFAPTALPHHSLSYTDTTLPPLERLHPATAAFFATLNIPSHTRLLHPTVFPLCTFGYALTRSAAKRLLNDIAAHESEGGTVAFDVRLLEACRDVGVRCWSVAPELMRHLDGGSEISEVDGGGGGAGENDVAAAGSTENIACGVRSNGEFWTSDPRRLEYLRDVVGRQGICLGRDAG